MKIATHNRRSPSFLREPKGLGGNHTKGKVRETCGKRKIGKGKGCSGDKVMEKVMGPGRERDGGEWSAANGINTKDKFA